MELDLFVGLALSDMQTKQNVMTFIIPYGQ